MNFLALLRASLASTFSASWYASLSLHNRCISTSLWIVIPNPPTNLAINCSSVSWTSLLAMSFVPLCRSIATKPCSHKLHTLIFWCLLIIKEFFWHPLKKSSSWSGPWNSGKSILKVSELWWNILCNDSSWLPKELIFDLSLENPRLETPCSRRAS